MSAGGGGSMSGAAVYPLQLPQDSFCPVTEHFKMIRDLDGELVRIKAGGHHGEGQRWWLRDLLIHLKKDRPELSVGASEKLPDFEPEVFWRLMLCFIPGEGMHLGVWTAAGGVCCFPLLPGRTNWHFLLASPRAAWMTECPGRAARRTHSPVG